MKIMIDGMIRYYMKILDFCRHMRLCPPTLHPPPSPFIISPSPPFPLITSHPIFFPFTSPLIPASGAAWGCVPESASESRLLYIDYGVMCVATDSIGIFLSMFLATSLHFTLYNSIVLLMSKLLGKLIFFL